MLKTQTIAEAEATYRKDLAARITYLIFSIAENIEEAEVMAVCIYEDEQERRREANLPPLPDLNYFGL